VLAGNVNPGQVVGAAQELFTVADLSTVWVIGDLFEKDFTSVGIGTPVAIAVPGRATTPIRARVAYIDPRIEPATRTAKVRVEVANPGGTLRLGMFVQMTFQVGGGERRALVPRGAVQSVGSRTVVYIPTEEEGRFLERSVTLGAPVGDAFLVVDGIRPGDKVVTRGQLLLAGGGVSGAVEQLTALLSRSRVPSRPCSCGALRGRHRRDPRQAVE
jgi:RND family efflux transporter MFP subunit